MEREKPSSPRYTRARVSAYSLALKFLSLRDHTKLQLRRKLKQREYTPEEIEEALEKLETQKYLNESRYAEVRSRSLLKKGLSTGMVQQKLSQEGAHLDEIQREDLKENSQETTPQLLQDLLDKRARLMRLPESKDEVEKYREKLLRSLAQKGHSYGVSQKALKEWEANHPLKSED